MYHEYQDSAAWMIQDFYTGEACDFEFYLPIGHFS